jgi:hypothetical protein
METESGSWRLYLVEDRKTERIGCMRGISAKDRNKIPYEYKYAAFRCFECRNMFHVPNAQPLPCSALPGHSPLRLAETECGEFLIHSCYV